MKTNTGFTLIEVMVTIAILGILTGISFYCFLNGLPERRVRAASRNLYAGLQETRSEAVKRGERITITFDPAADSYRITDANGNQIGGHSFAEYIDLYEVTRKDNSFTYNSRGMGVSATARIQYFKPGSAKMGVRVTSAGAIALIDEKDDNWE